MASSVNRFLNLFGLRREQSDLERRLLELNSKKIQEEDLDLKSEVLDWISNISSPLIFRYGVNIVERSFLATLYERGEIKDYEIDKALENYVLKKARENFNQSIGTFNYADHCANPEYLAEGIVRKQFSNEELSRIHFDHGENVFNFYNEYGRRNLISNLREDLLNPKPPIKKEPEKQLKLFEEKKRKSFDSCCCCDCYH